MSQSQACAEIKMPYVSESSITNKDRLIGIIEVVFTHTHVMEKANVECNRLYSSLLLL